MPQETKYLRFVDSGNSPSGKTKRWSVVSVRSNNRLGTIQWFGPWRQYAFFPEQGCVFNRECLSDVSSFLEDHKSDKP